MATRRRSGSLLLALSLTLSVATVTAQDDPAVVTTSNGAVRGVVVDGVASFKGIPYARPPVGPLRWRAPQPPEPWVGTRDASAFVHDCMQPASDFEVLATTPSEDCLYLNIWRPTYADPGDRLPVLVWIHGGAFVGGGTSDPAYDGSAFARQGLVVVSLNYRLGRMGFFAHPALMAESEDPVGTQGYLDQIAALTWVRDEIEAFGGDPGRVTVMGESAGGASVLALLTSPRADGLFGQAVVLSGGGRQPLVHRPLTGGSAVAPSADQVDAAFAMSLGITGDGPEALAALRALPAEELVAGHDLGRVFQQALGCAIAEIGDPAAYDPACRPALEGTPAIDGDVVPGTPEEIILARRATTVPILIGSTAADLAGTFPPRITDPYAWFGEDAEAARRHYRLPFIARAALVLRGQGSLRELLPVLSIGADMTMHEPARFVAREMTARGAKAWLYRFTYTAQSTRPESDRQSHAGELPFLFDTLATRYGDAVTDRDRQAAEAFNTYVAAFARTGDPNGGGLPRWPAFDPSAFDLMDFSLDDGPVHGPDPRAEGVALVERAADAQRR